MANEFKIKKGLIVTGASGGTVVDIQGSQGQLFSVTDDLSGSIFAVSDISGVPILDVNSSGLSTFDGNVLVGSDSSLLLSNNATVSAYAGTNDSLYLNSKGSGIVRVNYAGGTGGFEVFDGATTSLFDVSSAGNGTFAGTIDSGAITSTGIITGTIFEGSATTVNLMSSGSEFAVNLDNSVKIFGTGFTGTPRIIPVTTAEMDLGGSTNKWKDLYISGDANIGDQAFSAATSSGDGSSTLTTKGYVDGLITGATIYRGTWDPDITANSGNGTPDLSTVTQTSGYYYICSDIGTAHPNGTTGSPAVPCEPNSWAVGDWVVWNDDVPDCAGTGTGAWQKIDNTSVLSGIGTGQTVALWEGAGSVTDSETLGNAPITVTATSVVFTRDIMPSAENLYDIGSAATRWEDIYGDQVYGRDFYVDEYIYHNGDTNTYIRFTADTQTFRTGGDDRLILTNSLATFSENVLVGSGTIDNPQGWGKILQVQNSGSNGASLSVKDSNNEWNLATYNNYFYISDNVEERLTIDVNGNVGIGMSPTYRLDVESNNNRMRLLGTTGYVAIELQNGANGFYVAREGATAGNFSTGNTAYAGVLTVQGNYNLQLGTNGVIRQTIDGSGNVGIGTTTPQKKVHIEGTGAASEMQILVSSASDTVGHTAGIGLRGEGGESDGDLRIKGGIFFERIAGSFGNGKMILAVNSSVSNTSVTVADHALTIDTNKNVGIGTTGPGAKLDVYDSSTTVGNIVVAQFIKNYVGGSSIFRTGLSAGSTTADIEMNSGGAGPFRYGSYGEMNIVNNRPTSKINIVNNTSIAATIDSSGNVGIGVTGPGAKLDVNGSIRLSTSGAVEGRSYPYTTNIGSGANATTTYIKAGSSSKTEIELSGGDTNSNIVFKTPTSGNVTTTALTLDTSQNAIFSGNVGINSTSPPSLLDVQPTSANRKVTRIANDVMSTYAYYTSADAVLAWTCGSYHQAEVVITANQTNGGTTANLYIRGIWSNNHTSHHWDELEHIGSLPGSTITMSVGQNGSTTASGRLELDFNYGSGSFSQLNVRVTDFYGSHSYTIT